MGQLTFGQVAVTQRSLPAVGQSWTLYEVTGPPDVGGLSRTPAVVGEVGSAAAMTGDLQHSRRGRGMHT
jgi:hypothetical protein